MPATAQSPFDNANTDIILRTSDHVDFHVFRVILVLLSPVFQDMFSLPQPSSSSACTNVSSASAGKERALKLPSVDVSEDSQTLDALLRFLYPNTDGSFHSPQHARDVAVAVSKYDMSTLHGQIASKMQTQYVRSCPSQVYFIACQMGWKDVAKVAAKCSFRRAMTLKDGDLIRSGLLEFKGSGVAYRYLEEYRSECIRKLEDKLRRMDISSLIPDAPTREKINASPVVRSLYRQVAAHYSAILSEVRWIRMNVNFMGYAHTGRTSL